MKFEEQALIIYKKEIESVRNKMQKKLDKEIEKHEEKLNKILSEYSSIDEINEVFGYGMITSKKRDELISIFENFDKVKNYESPLGLCIKMLDSDIKNSYIELKDLEVERVKKSGEQLSLI